MWPYTSNDAGSSPTNYLQFSSVFFLLSAEESGAKSARRLMETLVRTGITEQKRMEMAGCRMRARYARDNEYTVYAIIT